jgi:hypothetical protein
MEKLKRMIDLFFKRIKRKRLLKKWAEEYIKECLKNA